MSRGIIFSFGLTSRCLPAMAALCFLWLAGAPALAHKVGCEVFTTPDGARLQVESWLGGGGSPKGVRVLVSRPDGSLYLEGKTDDEGMFLFAPEGRIPYRVAVEAGMGHRAETVVSAETLAELRLAGAGGQPGEAPGASPPEAAATGAPSVQSGQPGLSGQPEKAGQPGQAVPASRLGQSGAPASTGVQPAAQETGTRRSPRGGGLNTKEAAVLGLTFILALAAALTAYGNRARLKRIERQLNGCDTV